MKRLALVALLTACASEIPGDAQQLSGRWQLKRLECAAGPELPRLGELNRALSSRRYLSVLSVRGRTLEIEHKSFPLEGATGFCESKKTATLTAPPTSQLEVASEQLQYSRAVGLASASLCPQGGIDPTPRSSGFVLSGDSELRVMRENPEPGYCAPGQALTSVFERVL